MPNITASVGVGASVVCASSNVAQARVVYFTELSPLCTFFFNEVGLNQRHVLLSTSNEQAILLISPLKEIENLNTTRSPLWWGDFNFLNRISGFRCKLQPQNYWLTLQHYHHAQKISTGMVLKYCSQLLVFFSLEKHYLCQLWSRRASHCTGLRRNYVAHQRFADP